MHEWPMLGLFVGGVAAGGYVGLCLGFIIGRLDARFLRWLHGKWSDRP